MRQQFTVESVNNEIKTGTFEKETATVIYPGTFVALDANKFIVPATATSTAIWACVSVDGNKVKILDHEVPLKVVSDVPFARIYTNNEVDLTIDGSGNQVVDLDASTTDVFRVIGWIDENVIGTNLVTVKINKPIYIR